MIIRLDDEVAFVSGAANGIGRGIAVGMAAAGASVALLDRDKPGLLDAANAVTEAGGRASFHPVDVSDPDAVSAAVEAASAALGDPTILVTAAAIDASVPITQLSGDAWRSMVDVNLNGTFYCLQAVLPAMRRHGRGRIIFIGSNIALKGGADIAHYGAAKAGVHGLTRCAAIDLAPLNITVNTIAPGPIDTDMLRGLPPAWLEAKRQELLAGRFGTVDEVVPTAILLASSAGGFYTGATLNVSGGDVLQ